MVLHRFLLSIFEMCGLVGNVIRLTETFLSCTSFGLRVGEAVYSSAEAPTHLLQGSVSDSLLCIMPMNDIPKFLKVACTMFVDYIKLLSETGNVRDLQADLYCLSSCTITMEL